VLSLGWAEKQLQTLRLQPHGGIVKAIDDVPIAVKIGSGMCPAVWANDGGRRCTYASRRSGDDGGDSASLAHG
jgi:hypothetical protein